MKLVNFFCEIKEYRKRFYFVKPFLETGIYFFYRDSQTISKIRKTEKKYCVGFCLNFNRKNVFPSVSFIIIDNTFKYKIVGRTNGYYISTKSRFNKKRYFSRYVMSLPYTRPFTLIRKNRVLLQEEIFGGKISAEHYFEFAKKLLDNCFTTNYLFSHYSSGVKKACQYFDLDVRLIPVSFQHGDMHHLNVLEDSGEYCVIDYDLIDYYPPLYDFFTFAFDANILNQALTILKNKVADNSLPAKNILNEKKIQLFFALFVFIRIDFFVSNGSDKELVKGLCLDFLKKCDNIFLLFDNEYEASICAYLGSFIYDDK